MNYRAFSSILMASAYVVVTAVLLAVNAQAQSMQANVMLPIWDGLVKVVVKGDQVVVDTAALQSADSEVTVKWRQSFKNRKAVYLQTVGAIRTGDRSEIVNIFVQKDRADAFLKNCSKPSGSHCTIEVGKAFQYGESLTAAYRFLVYHDKASRPFMRRFISPATTARFKQQAHKLAQDLGGSSLATSIAFAFANYTVNYAGAFFGNDGGTGNSLRNFRSERSGTMNWLAEIEYHPMQEKVARIYNWSEACNHEAKRLFSRTDPNLVKHFQRKCWHHGMDAWRTIANRVKRGVDPSYFGTLERNWKSCIKGAPRKKGRARDQVLSACEVLRKVKLLEIGADPTVHYDYSRSAAFSQYVASGKWRLHK